MSAINSLSGATRQAPSAYESMTSEDFLRVMFAELTRQDPTKPTDSKDLLDQLGSIRGIESDLSLTKRLDSFAKQNEITAASGLVGAFVEGKTDSGVDTRGFVDSISVTRDGVLLNLSSTYSIKLSSVSTIHDPALITTDPPATTTPPATTPPADTTTPASSSPLEEPPADEEESGARGTLPAQNGGSAQ